VGMSVSGPSEKWTATHRRLMKSGSQLKNVKVGYYVIFTNGEFAASGEWEGTIRMKRKDGAAPTARTSVAQLSTVLSTVSAG
jgi:hypothetical protein